MNILIPRQLIQRALRPAYLPRHRVHLQQFARYSSSSRTPSLPTDSLLLDTQTASLPDIQGDELSEEGFLSMEDGLEGPEATDGFEGESDYPDLMTADPLFDAMQDIPLRYQSTSSRLTIRNDPPLSKDPLIAWEARKVEDKPDRFQLLPISRNNEKLHIYPMITRNVTQQTRKGKKHRMYFLYVVGNGDGLVGFGEGKHENVPQAKDAAIAEAIRNMDYVERFERRTIWTEIETKMSATRIQMWPRPVGFGLHCNPNIHQVLKAAGIKDVTAKVWGSRNPITVIKATCRMIQSGHAPLSMGDGLGGKGRKLDAGGGIRGKGVIERERGRKILDARTW